MKAGYSEIPFPGGFRGACIDHAKWERDALRAAVMDDPAIDAATLLSAQWNDEGHPFGAVYVMGVDGLDKCKIGFSTNPTKRIRQLKTGLWAAPKVYALIWSQAFIARTIEMHSLRLAKRRSLRLSGEWINLAGSDAVNVVLDAITFEAFTDSGTFVDQWAPAFAMRSNPTRQAEAVSVEDLHRWERDQIVRY
jgi:hypothetical protein